MKKNMEISVIILLVFIGLLGGILSGIFGIGGGTILVPALIFILGYSQHLAQGTTLGMLLPPVGILAVWAYYKKGLIDLRASMLLAIGFIVGSLIGAKIAVELPQNVLRKLFALFLAFIAIRMFFK